MRRVVILLTFFGHRVVTFDLRVGVVGCAKASLILRHRGVQLILTYSWARPASLVAGKGRGGFFFYFFCFFTFILVPLFFLSLSFTPQLSFYLLSPFSGRRHKTTHKGWCAIKPQRNQLTFGPFIYLFYFILYIYVLKFCGLIQVLAKWSADPTS